MTTPVPQETFWGQLGEPERRLVRTVSTVQRFRSGATIFGDGDASRWVLVLTRGRVKIVASGPGGHEAVLNLCGPGDVIGELAAVDGSPRSAGVIAVDAVTALWLPFARFTSLVNENVVIAAVVMRVITSRLRRADVHRAEFGDRTTRVRVARLLADLACRYGKSTPDGLLLALPVNQTELAGLVGASREAIGRALRALRDDGILSTGRQRMTIHDLAALRDLAAG